MGEKNIFDTLWQQHTVSELEGGYSILSIDRCYLHDLSGPGALQMLAKAKLPCYDRNRVFAIPDHTIASAPGRTEETSPISAKLLPAFRKGCAGYHIPMFDLDNPHQGIVHVVGPETGLTLPGMTVVCGDSHTCTHGAMGAIAWGVGTSELYQTLATQALIVKKPKTMYIEIDGKMAPGAGAMDMMLYLLHQYGVSLGIGYAIEYGGSVIRQMSMEERMTICNLTVEMGAQYAIISPDETTLSYIEGREYAPKGEDFDALRSYALSIASPENAEYDKVLHVDVTGVGRRISWGINPSQNCSVDESVPSEEKEKSDTSWKEAIEYMGLKPEEPVQGLPVDYVFIGSCSNGRIEALRQAAEVAKGKKVADGVTALVVPGSQTVKKQAEAEGLDKILKDAGFIWGEPCCSLCGGCNGERIGSGKRCVSTTNRNFIGRQGPGARTHLASPRTAAMAAINGKIS